MAVKGLSHIGIKVESCERSEMFYSRNLDFEKYYEYIEGNAHLMFMRAGSCVLEFIERKGLEISSPGRVDHVALEVEDIDEVMDRLKANGFIDKNAACGFMEKLFGGARNFFFEGPDGERIELFEVTGSR